jgi:RNA polymerase sigma factor (sigma-70 family)
MLSRITKSFGDAGRCGNHDDLAQNICLKLFLKFDEFDGTGEDYLHFVTKVIKNGRVDAAAQRKKEREIEVPFYVDETDEDGNVEEVENPVFYETSYHQKMVSIPESIQGEDLQICRWLLTGMKLAEIAFEVGLTESAVKKRISRIRERESAVLAHQREQRKKNDAPEKERQTYRQRMNQEYIDRVNSRLHSLQQDD